MATRADRLAALRAEPTPRVTTATLGTAATIVVLLLSYLERSILAEPIRGGFALLHFDPALFRAGVAVLAVLLPLVLAALAWRIRGSVLPIGAGQRGKVLYLALLGVYALAVWLPAILPAGEPLTVFRAVQVLAVPLTIVGFVFILPALVGRVDYTRIFSVFLWTSLAFGVISLIWVVLGRQDFFGIPLVAQPDDRGGPWAASGFFVQRNTIGSFLLVVIPAAVLVALADVRSGRRGRAILDMAAIGLLAVWLGLTFSRSSQLGLVVAAGVAVLALGWGPASSSPAARHAQAGVKVLTLIGLIAVAIGVASSPLWLPGLESAFATTIVEGLHGRLRIWEDLWQQTEAHRWIGTGLFGVVSIGPGGIEYGEVYTPHNAFLAQLAFFGLPGLIAFTLLLVAVVVEGLIRRWRHLAMEDAVVLGALAGILVQNQFEHILTYPVLFSNSLALILLGWWRGGPRRASVDVRQGGGADDG